MPLKSIQNKSKVFFYASYLFDTKIISFSKLCAGEYLYCKPWGHNIEVFLQSSLQVFINDVYKTKTDAVETTNTDRFLLGHFLVKIYTSGEQLKLKSFFWMIQWKIETLHDLCWTVCFVVLIQRCTHQTTQCRLPVACVHYRTGLVHGESYWKSVSCHNQLCSFSQCPPLQTQGEVKLLL